MNETLDHRILGVWRLAPNTPEQGDRAGLSSGVTTILGDRDGGLYFHVRATTVEGLRIETSFSATPDGLPQPIPGGEQEMVTRAGPATLTTEVFDDGVRVHTAIRRVAAGGDELRVDQELVAPDRTVTRTHAVYTRAAVKQVICYRRDLKMRKGKIAAQCAHASMAVFFQRDRGGVDELVLPLDGPMATWAKGSSGKVVLSVDDEEALLEVHQEARARGLPTALITDSGRTEFGGVPTRTAVAVGPAVVEEIDAITGPRGLVKTKLA